MKNWTPKTFVILAIDLLVALNMRPNGHSLETLHTPLTLTLDGDRWRLEPNPLGWGDAFAPSSPEQAHTLYHASFGTWLGEWTAARGTDGQVHADRAYALARGSHQTDVALGQAAVSGSTLRGGAAKYRNRYKTSVNVWLQRCASAGVQYSIEPYGVGRRNVLVFGAPLQPDEAAE